MTHVTPSRTRNEPESRRRPGCGAAVQLEVRLVTPAAAVAGRLSRDGLSAGPGGREGHGHWPGHCGPARPGPGRAP